MLFGSLPNFRKSQFLGSPLAPGGAGASMQERRAIPGSPSAWTPPINGEPLPSPAGNPVLDAVQNDPGRWSVNPEGQTMGAGAPAQSKGGGLPVPLFGALGGSMRAPFDYDKAFGALAGDQKKIKDWQWIVGGLAAALGNPMGINALLQRRDAQEDRMANAQRTLMDWKYRDYARQNEADLQASNPFTVGRDRIGYDPATGESRVLYDGPEDFELYAQELGLEPGSDNYFRAVEDYVLRSAGPSAHGRDISLDDHRTANDRSLETLRFNNRKAMEDVRQGNRRGMVDYRNSNPPPVRPRPAASSATKPAKRNDKVYVNDKGQRIRWDGKAWVPAK